MTTIDMIASRPISMPDVDSSSALKSRRGRYTFKLARTPAEFAQLHRLNHRTFVHEIPQHADPGGGMLVDRFHAKNSYFIALCGARVVGMVAVHDKPPFSVAARLPDPRRLDRLRGPLLEVRLLAIEPEARHGAVFAGLVWMVWEYALARGYSHILISGLAQRQRLYKRLGFRPLGPAVRSGQADYIPMAAAMASLPSKFRDDVEYLRRRIAPLERTHRTKVRPVSFLPGPVQLSDEVRSAFAQPPISHRSPEFAREFARVRRRLSAMVGGADVALMCGSGTLANDAIAATLSANPTCDKGIILVNGEFGQRLVRQAERLGLAFAVANSQWASAWNLSGVQESLVADPCINWVWGVHLETSTGMLNDIDGLVQLCRRQGVRVCLDCVSSLGAVPLDLAPMHLASGASGKSLGSVAGLAFVFAAPGGLSDVRNQTVPTYLDVRAAIEVEGPRYTLPSPLLDALDAALKSYATPRRRELRYQHYAHLGRFIRRELAAMGLVSLVADGRAAPVITSFAPHDVTDTRHLLDACEEKGFVMHGRSGYLHERGLVQIATMGDVALTDCQALLETLRVCRRVAGTCARRRPPNAPTSPSPRG